MRTAPTSPSDLNPWGPPHEQVRALRPRRCPGRRLASNRRCGRLRHGLGDRRGACEERNRRHRRLRHLLDPAHARHDRDAIQPRAKASRSPPPGHRRSRQGRNCARPSTHETAPDRVTPNGDGSAFHIPCAGATVRRTVAGDDMPHGAAPRPDELGGSPGITERLSSPRAVAYPPVRHACERLLTPAAGIGSLARGNLYMASTWRAAGLLQRQRYGPVRAADARPATEPLAAAAGRPTERRVYAPKTTSPAPCTGRIRYRDSHQHPGRCPCAKYDRVLTRSRAALGFRRASATRGKR